MTTAPGGSTEAASTQWLMSGYDLAQTRANLTATNITRENVAKLAKTWEIPDLVGVSGTPTVTEGLAYFADWTGQVWAVRADSGEKVWTTMIGGMITSSVVIDGDAVYTATGNKLYRLNRATGEKQWEATTNDHPQAQISSSPVVVDGLVLQGTASFENMMRKDQYQFRGSMGAFDAETGQQRWNFFSTPDDPTAGAGGGIWSTPAVDTGRGMLFVGTGQGLSEPTPPMADSLVALDYRTGEKKWSTQFTNPDVFSAMSPAGKDHDVGASPNLWTADGRDLVGAGDKAGTFHALDRDTGAVVWNAELTPGSVFGGEIGSAAVVDGVIVASSNVGDPNTNAPTDVSHLFGLDPATGDKRWTSPEYSGKIFAPVSAVPGVAFCGTDQGQLMAVNTETGQQLWTMQAPAKVGSGPSIVEGRVLWGYGFTLFGGSGPGGILALELQP